MKATAANFGTLITIGFGIWAIVQPDKFAKLIALAPIKKYGITEIRSTYGGWICGFAGFTLYQQNALLFQCLGVAWFSTAAVRLFSSIFEENLNQKTTHFIVIELLVGCLLCSTTYL